MSDSGTDAPASVLQPTGDAHGSSTAPGKMGTGVLPYQTLGVMVRAKEISAAIDIDPAQMQPASLDLRLGRYAYQVRASFLPGPAAEVMDKVRQMDGEPPLDLANGAVLQKGCVYVVELLESVRLSNAVMGLANPKSSTGRLDVLTRLITDRGSSFDQIDRGYEGKLYVEVAPQTFNVVVRQGSRLNQVRLQRGSPIVASGDLTNLLRVPAISSALPARSCRCMTISCLSPSI